VIREQGGRRESRPTRSEPKASGGGRLHRLGRRLVKLVDSLDLLVYALLFLLGFGGLAYVGYISIVG